MKKILYVVTFLCLSISSLALFAEGINDSTIQSEMYAIPEKVKSTDALNDVPDTITDFELLLALAILIFGLCVLCIELYLIKNKQIESEDAVRIVTMTLIIIGALFLVAAGYNNNQIAPPLGLLGTMAGYILGKATNNNKTS